MPIETSPEVEFWLNGRRLEMQPGELWYVNVNLRHLVANRTKHSRTHLVIDCEVNEWIRTVFEHTLTKA